MLLWHWDDLQPFFRSLNPWNKIPLVVNDPVSTVPPRLANVDSEFSCQHYEKMKVYKPIPRWWYFIVLAIAYAMAQASQFPPILRACGN